MTTPHPLSPRADCARHVSTQARLMTAAAAVFGLWQFAWLAREAEHLEQVLPTPWSVEFWMAAWMIVAIAGIVAAVTAAFPAWSGDGVKVSVGDLRSDEGVLFRCVQAHTTQADWTPAKTPALWTPVRKTTGAAPDEWKAPAGAQDAYRKGDRVTFQGAVWESVIDANVWSPSAYPAGWKAV